MKPLIIDLIQALLDKHETITTNINHHCDNYDMTIIELFERADGWELSGVFDSSIDELDGEVHYTSEQLDTMTLKKFGKKWVVF